MGIFSRTTFKVDKMKIFALCAASAAAFTAQPTGGVRSCEYYKITATANFDLGINGSGTLTFTQDGCDDKVQISGSIGLKKEDGSYAAGTSHGYHIHTTGIQDASSCGPASTGGHFNPFDAPSGHFNNNRKNREVAQIGQLFCDSMSSCKALENPEDNLIKLHGVRNIIGRSIVVHVNPEYNYDEDGNMSISPAGRMACATISLKSEEVRN